MSDPEHRDDDLTTDEEIEIIEVIGLDEDSPAARPRDATPPGGRASEGPAHETTLALEEERAEPAEADPAGATARRPEEEADRAQEDRERLARLSADFEGLRKRVEREREANERQAAAKLITRLLPVLDNFERALGNSGGEAGPGFRDGIALIFRQLLEELRREGLAAVDSVGETFDPTHHEAVSTSHEPGLPSHTVVEELQRGYLLHDRLLRPALVRVSLDPNEQDLDLEEQ